MIHRNYFGFTYLLGYRQCLSSIFSVSNVSGAVRGSYVSVQLSVAQKLAASKTATDQRDHRPLPIRLGRHHHGHGPRSKALAHRLSHDGIESHHLPPFLTYCY